jgi:hypothetical protein
MDWSIVAIILQLIFLEGILSIDNAAVLGAMVTHLPDDRAIIWPRHCNSWVTACIPCWAISARRRCAWDYWVLT